MRRLGALLDSHVTATMVIVVAMFTLARVVTVWAQTAAPTLLPAQIDQWTTVVGVLLPLGIAAINRERWAPGQKALAAIGICILAAAGDVFFKGQFSLTNWSQTALYIFFLVVTSYAGLWRPTGIADTIGKATG